MTEVTRILAKYVANSSPSDIPEAVRAESVRTFVNWLGCVLSGSTDQAVDRAAAALAPFAGSPQATVIGKNVRSDIGTAAFLNTLSNFIHSYNDTHLATVAHPTGAVASALFALAERRPMTGEEFLHAMIIGMEVECRIANMIAAPPAQVHHGLSTCGFTSVFGSTVAAGIILGLDEQQMVWALGNAVAQAAGCRSTHASMASHVIPAHQSRNGLVAAHLALNGFTCSERSIEGPKGFAEVFAIKYHLEHAVAGLGTHYEFMRNAYKPFPCGIVNHAAIDASLRLAGRADFDPAEVRSVRLRVHPLCIALADRPNPRHRLEALVSVQHWTAAALVEGAAGLDQGTDRCVGDPGVVAMRGRIAATADPDLAPESAVVSVVMADGRELESSVDRCIGSHDRPMTDAELDEKFLTQARLAVTTERAHDLLEASRRIDRATDVGSIAARYFQSADLERT